MNKIKPSPPQSQPLLSFSLKGAEHMRTTLGPTVGGAELQQRKRQKAWFTRSLNAEQMTCD